MAHELLKCFNDSDLQVEKVFDRLIHHGSLQKNMSTLYAKLCTELFDIYPNLSSHILGIIKKNCEDLKELSVADAKINPKGDYNAFLDHNEIKQRVMGNFRFLSELYATGVVSLDDMKEVIFALKTAVDGSGVPLLYMQGLKSIVSVVKDKKGIRDYIISIIVEWKKRGKKHYPLRVWFLLLDMGDLLLT